MIRIQITLTWHRSLLSLVAEVVKSTNNWVKADWVLDRILDLIPQQQQLGDRKHFKRRKAVRKLPFASLYM